MKPNYKGWREGCVMLFSTKDGIFAHSLSALLVRADTSDRTAVQLWGSSWLVSSPSA